MMKLRLLLFAFLPVMVFSQITLTDVDFADAGDTVRMSKATDNSIDIITTGANQTWDYSYLTFDSQLRRDFEETSNLPFLINAVFGQLAQNQYRATYYLPATDLPINQVGSFLPITIADLVQYSRKTADSITSIGLSLSINGTALPVRSDTIETRYAFPLNYGDVHYSRGYSKIDMNPIYDAIWIQYRQRLSEVDGWGSITTPFGTYDALRIKHTITETDSLRIDLLGNQTWIPIPVPKSYIYEWFTNGEKDALLRISTSETGGNETVTSIEYRDFNLTNSIDELAIDFEIYPNPANQVISVNNFPFNSQYYVVDNNGSIVLEGDLIDKINIAHLASGSYELVIKADKQIGKKSFIKQD